MKFKIGDKVEVVKYGHVVWMSKSLWQMLLENKMANTEKPDHLIDEDDNNYYYDLSPEAVGRIGVVDGVSSSGYSLNATSFKSSWYSDEQLKLV